MGIVRMGPPTEIVLPLALKFHVDSFVETGTFLGDTSYWASQHFGRVITIENSRKIFDDTITRLGSVPNIEFCFGNSKSELITIMGQLCAPAILWLDSHWCGGDSFGHQDQCPLLDELAIINQSDIEHFLFIDDARLFLSPPPVPNIIEQWPTIAEVIDCLACGKTERYVVVIEDVIIAVPKQAKESLSVVCQNINTEAWHQYGKLSRQAQRSQLMQGVQQVMNGTGIMLNGLKNALLRK